MTVFRRFLADRSRTDLWWGVAMLANILLNLAFFPGIKGQTELDQTVEDLPPALQAMFGIEEGVSIGSAAGYLQAQLFSSVVPILLLILAVAVGSSAIGGSEDDGSLEFTLSYPVTRLRLLLARFAAVAVTVAAHSLLLVLMTLALAPLFGALDGVSVGGLIVACLGCGALALLHASVAFSAGAWFGKRTPAIIVAGAIAALGYIAHGLLSTLDVPGWVRYLTPWYWFLRENLLAAGPSWVAFVPATVLSFIVAALAVPSFQRRDIHGS
jgi:ABC-2 type transport system permease protein